MGVRETSVQISKAARKAIKPLVRLLIHWGIGFKDFSEELRQAYLEEGTVHLRKKKKEITSSSLSLITGIHRKETSQYLKEPGKDDKDDTSRKASAAFSVLSAWITGSDFLDKKKKPLPLNYLSRKNSKVSFTSLCESVTRDVRAKAILDELLRLDLVAMEDGIVTLKKGAFIPDNDLEKKLAFFSRNISEHLSAASSNIIGEKASLFERMASHDQLTDKDIEELRAFIDERGMALLIEIYQKAEKMAQKNKEAKDKSASRRMSLGVFLNVSSAGDDDA